MPDVSLMFWLMRATSTQNTSDVQDVCVWIHNLNIWTEVCHPHSTISLSKMCESIVFDRLILHVFNVSELLGSF